MLCRSSKITRRDFLKKTEGSAVGAVSFPYIFSLSASQANGNVTARPNVVLIYTDDQDNNEVGCYGGNVSTPHIDSLAAEGIKFTRFYPSSPVCSPSRYSVLTGRYASRSRGLQSQHPTTDHAFIRWNTPFVAGEETLATMLGRHGYVTGMVGKWHNGEPKLKPIPPDADATDPQVAKRVKDIDRKTCEHIRRCTGFDYVDGIYGQNITWMPIPSSLQVHNQDWLTSCALRFIQQNARRPFFLYMATTLPHAPNPLTSLKADPRITPAGYLDEAPNVQPSRADILHRADEAGLRKEDFRRGTWAAIAWLDDGVGAILHKLDEFGLTENTMVIFTSDHANRGKMTCYAGPVPCIVRWKSRIPAGMVCDELVSNIDVAPTILSACGVSPPGNHKLDGSSWQPLWQKTDTSWRDSLLIEITYTRGVLMKDWNYVAIRYPETITKTITPENRRQFSQEGTRVSQGSRQNESVRYNADRDFPGYYDYDQLYDLRADPKQQENLAGDPKYAARLRDMKERLCRYCEVLPHPFGEFRPASGP
ncbi:MAG: hypothetical protein A2Z25_01185 [Planctomycetes bacterium RBG_16_55_9]|nr:MAG: hypothetical protein A2Z25_01185 [Planctomycetes bacterium RBG_16_55_9]